MHFLANNQPRRTQDRVDLATFEQLPRVRAHKVLLADPVICDFGGVAALGSLFSDRFPICRSSIVFGVRIIVQSYDIVRELLGGPQTLLTNRPSENSMVCSNLCLRIMEYVCARTQSTNRSLALL